MSERLRGVCRAGSSGVACAVLLAACAGGAAAPDPSAGDDDLAEEDVAFEGDDPTDDGSTDDGSADDGAEGADEFEQPTPEETTEEAPAEVEIDATRIEVATLPIGGGPLDDNGGGDDHQCVDVGWSDPPELPTGVTVVIEDLLLEPVDHFVLSDRSCPGAPPCLPDHEVTVERRCTVAVGWTEAAGFDGGSLRASGTLVCDAAADVCAAFQAAVEARGDASVPLAPPLNVTTPFGTGDGDESSGSSGEGSQSDGEQDVDDDSDDGDTTDGDTTDSDGGDSDGGDGGAIEDGEG